MQRRRIVVFIYKKTINNPLFRLNPPGHIDCLWFMVQKYKHFFNQQIKMQEILENNIYQGDCFELIKGIPDGTVDCVITDPPYGTTINKWDKKIDIEAMFQELKRVIKPNGAMCIFGQEPFSSKMRIISGCFRYDWIFHKTKAAGFLLANKMPLRAHEVISVFYKKLPTYNPQFTVGKPYNRQRQGRAPNYGNIERIPTINNGKRYPIDVLQIDSCKNTECCGHHTQKPVALIEYLIKTYTNPGEMVLDCFLGSGTTAVAAINTGRKYIGFEKEAEYIEMAKKRIEALQ
mgnify:CR=1 FL=1